MFGRGPAERDHRTGSPHFRDRACRRRDRNRHAQVAPGLTEQSPWNLVDAERPRAITVTGETAVHPPAMLGGREAAGEGRVGPDERTEGGMLLGRPIARMVFGLVLVAIGARWTLQGLDVLGQDGGMNGRQEWVVVGAVALVAGMALPVSGYRARYRS